MSDFLGVIRWLFGEGPTLFGVALAAGGGIALALAPQIRNIRLSHWFFRFAWVWAFGGLIEGVGDMKQSLPSYIVVFVGSGLIGLMALTTYRWVERNHHEAFPSASTPQDDNSRIQAELNEVNDFICKKDENDLRNEFDFPDMLNYNIEFAKRNIAPQLVSRDASAQIDAFFLNGQARLDMRYAKVTVVNNRAQVDWIPGNIGVINTTQKYAENRKQLATLISSASLPTEVTAALKLLDDAIEKDSTTLIESLNQSLKSDPRNILENSVYGSNWYGSASGLYWRQFIPLRPSADVVTLAVRKAMGKKSSAKQP